MKNFTLRQIIQKADLVKVYELLSSKSAIAIEVAKRNYEPVVVALLAYPKVKTYKFKWYVSEATDSFDGTTYVDVGMTNPGYVKPKKNLEPWGCDGKKRAPKGFYNCNAEKHNKFFGCGGTDRRKLIDTPVIVKVKGLSIEELTCEILWELTFYGFENPENGLTL